MVIRRFAGRGLDSEELYQLGAIGLWKAIQGFDESRGFAFSTYAVPMIVGEIRLFLRKDSLLHVSRQLKEHAGLIAKATEKLQKDEKREPSLEELMQETKLTRDQILLALEANQHVASLQEMELKSEPVEDLSHAFKEETLVEHLSLQKEIDSLSPQEQEFIHLRYDLNLTQTQVAKQLQMSQVTVSRMERRVLIKLREGFDRS